MTMPKELWLAIDALIQQHLRIERTYTDLTHTSDENYNRRQVLEYELSKYEDAVRLAYDGTKVGVDQVKLKLAVTERVNFRKKRHIEQLAGSFDHSPGCVLLIGDSPAPDFHDHEELEKVPFGAPGNCSFWLNAMLEKNEIQESNLAWINAYDEYGISYSYEILNAKWGAIVTLGNNAQKWLKKAPRAVSHLHVYHPQAWKRFNSSKPYPLIDILKTFEKEKNCGLPT